MPIVNDYGYGKWTLKKLADFDYFLRVYLSIVANVQKNQQKKGWVKSRNFDPEIDLLFHYIDMNAGPGILPDLKHNQTDEILVPSGTLGSPFLFKKHAEMKGVNYYVDFIEQNPISAKMLLCHLINSPLSNGHGKGWIKDHNEIVPILLNDYRKWKFGLIYHDPNNGDVSFETLKYCAEKRPCYDILINFPASLFKRRIENRELEIKLSDHLSRIPKKKVFIKDLSDGDIHQWTFIFLTNYIKMSDIKAIGLHEITKPEGAKMFERANLTKRQIKKKNDNQPPLFPTLPTGNI